MGIYRNVVAIISVMMTLDIVEVDNMIVSGTVLIIIEDLLPAITDLVVMENISLQVVEFGGNFPG